MKIVVQFIISSCSFHDVFETIWENYSWHRPPSNGYLFIFYFLSLNIIFAIFGFCLFVFIHFIPFLYPFGIVMNWRKLIKLLLLMTLKLNELYVVHFFKCCNFSRNEGICDVYFDWLGSFFWVNSVRDLGLLLDDYAGWLGKIVGYLLTRVKFLFILLLN